MCAILQKKYFLHTLLLTYRAAKFRVNMLKEIIEVDIRVLALMFPPSKNTLINV